MSILHVLSGVSGESPAKTTKLVGNGCVALCSFSNATVNLKYRSEYIDLPAASCFDASGDIVCKHVLKSVMGAPYISRMMMAMQTFKACSTFSRLSLSMVLLIKETASSLYFCFLSSLRIVQQSLTLLMMYRVKPPSL